MNFIRCLQVLFLCFSAAASQTVGKELPAFFDDSLNLIAVGVGVGMVVISSIISWVLCKKAERVREKRGLLFEKDDD